MYGNASFWLGPIPVRVEPIFWLVAVLLGLGAEPWQLVVWVVVVFVSILTHEVGHAALFRAFGQRPAIVLHGFGGLTFGDAPLSKWRHIAVSLAGPLAGMGLLGLPAHLLDRAAVGAGSEVFTFALTQLVWVNVLWSIVNLLPVRPLDGGHVMGELVGEHTARWISVVVGGAVALAALLLQLFYPALLFAMLTASNLAEARQGQPLWMRARVRVEGAGTRREQRRRRREFERATTRPGAPGPWPEPAVADAPAPPVPPAPVVERPPPRPTVIQLEAGAWNALRRGDLATARERLDAIEERASSPFLDAAMLLAEGAEERAVAAYAAAWAAAPSGPRSVQSTELLADAGLVEAVVARLMGAAPDAAGGLLRQLRDAGRPEQAAEIAVAVAARGANPDAALEAARGWARAGDVRRTLRWLRTARERGADLRAELRDPEYARLASSPAFQRLRAEAAG